MGGNIEINLAVFGRGGAIEHSKYYSFQLMDIELIKKLSARFETLIYLPPTINKNDSQWSTLKNFWTGELKNKNVQIIPLYSYNSFSGKTLLTRKVRAIFQWFSSLNRVIASSDICLIYMPSPMALVGFFIAKLLKRPVITYLGGEWGASNPAIGQNINHKYRLKAFLRLKQLLQNTIIRHSDAVLFRDRQKLALWENKIKRSFYIKGNSRLRHSHLHFRQDTCNKESVGLLSVCSLVPNKGVTDILVAAYLLKKRGYNILFSHAGAYYNENMINAKNLTRELGLENRVKYYGFLQDFDQLIKLYRKSDIYVLASHSEGFPRAITEAQSQSLPVVATDVGGIPMVLKHRKNALLVKPREPKQLADAIEEIIQNNALRKKIILNGHRMVNDELFGKNAEDLIYEIAFSLKRDI